MERIVAYRDPADLWLEGNVGGSEREERFFDTTINKIIKAVQQLH
jgi:hypothetical protein